VVNKAYHLSSFFLHTLDEAGISLSQCIYIVRNLFMLNERGWQPARRGGCIDVKKFQGSLVASNRVSTALAGCIQYRPGVNQFVFHSFGGTRPLPTGTVWYLLVTPLWDA